MFYFLNGGEEGDKMNRLILLWNWVKQALMGGTGYPICFDSDPTSQEQAENDCANCPWQDDCVPEGLHEQGMWLEDNINYGSKAHTKWQGSNLCEEWRDLTDNSEWYRMDEVRRKP